MKLTMLRVLFSFSLLLPLTLHAFVLVNTQKGKASDWDKWNKIHQVIRASILEGHWDGRALKLPTTSPPGWILIDSSTFKNFSREVQKEIVARLAIWDDNMVAYKVTVDTKANELEKMPVIKRLGVNVSHLPANVPAEKLMSRYAQKWAYKISDKDGPNCLHTALASVFSQWIEPMYLETPAYLFMRGAYFKPITELAEWGDMIYLNIGRDNHAFTFLGVDREDPTRKIVFTKNGYERSHFLFMSYQDVLDFYEPDTISFYRPVVDPPPPSTGDGGWLANDVSRPAKFAAIEGAIRRGDLAKVAPIKTSP